MRCGQTGVREVVSRRDVQVRIRAAVDAGDPGADTLLLARTDVRSTLGLDEAIWRVRAFDDLGAGILFLEAPRDEGEMARFCRELSGVRMVHMLEEWITALASPARRAPSRRVDFQALRGRVGFPDHDRLLATSEGPVGEGPVGQSH